MSDTHAAHQRLSFLAEASHVLASSLDLAVTLQQAARLTIPVLADACIIYLVDAEGAARATAVAHVNADDEAALWELQRRYPDPASAKGALGRVLASAESVCFPETDPAARLARARDADHRALLERLGTRSAMIVPLVARGQVLGAVSLMISTSDRRYGPEDVQFAEDLARRCALAVDNARLYDAAQHEIAERARVQHALQQSEERYRYLVDQASDVVYQCDADGRFTFVNPVATTLLGYAPETVIGRHYLELIRDDLRPAVRRYYLRQFARRLPTTYLEIPVITNDGLERWLGQNVTLIEQDGQVLGFQAIARDVTERKRTAEALAMLQAVSAVVAGTLEPGQLAEIVVGELATRFGYELPSVYFLAPDGIMRLAAQRGYDQPIHELRPEQGIVGRVQRTLKPALIQDTQREPDFLCAAEGIVAEACVPIVRSGELLGIVNVETRRRGVLGEHDVRLLTALAEMMTVALENARLFQAAQDEIAERRRAEDKLRTQRDFDREVLETMGQGLLVIDGNGRVRYANPASATMAARPTGDVIGGTPLDLVHPDDRTRLAGRSSSEVEVRLVRPDGSALPVMVTTRPWAHHRDPEGSILVITDLTERKRAEAALAEVVRTKDELVAMISHELRSPASVLIGYAELLATREYSSSEQREIATSMVQQGRQLAQIMDDFVQLQHVERNQLSVRPRSIDLRPLLTQAARTAAHDAEHPFEMHVADPLPTVTADPARVEQVLTNLLGNARKYTPAGGRITLSARQRGDVVEIAVADQGLGIPANALDKLFDKFYRVESDDRRGIPGTGLGLAIVRELVEAQGGKVGAESEGTGKGTRFWFTLPLAAVQVADAPLPAPAPTLTRVSPLTPVPTPTPVVTPTPAGRGLRILAVDDEPSIGAMLRRLLRGDGHQVETAGSTADALDRLRSTSFDAVVSDLSMGTGSDGLTLAQEIRRDWPGTRFVLASGTVGLDPSLTADRGVDAILQKPYQLDDLRQALQPAHGSAPVAGSVEVVLEPTPSVVEPKPAGVEPQPAGVETQPAGVEPQPAGVEPQPAGVEPQPAGVEPQPAGVEAQPAGVEPERAHVEPRPLAPSLSVTSGPKKYRVLFVDDEPSLLSALRRMLFPQRQRWDMTFVVGGQAALDAMQQESFDVLVTDMRMPGMDGAALLREAERCSPHTARLVLSGYADTEATETAKQLAQRILTKPCEPDVLVESIEHACNALQRAA